MRKHMTQRSACVPCKPHASQGAIDIYPMYFKAIKKRSAIAIGPAANVLNFVDAALPPPLPRQLLCVHADGLRVAPEDKTAQAIPLHPLPR